ncbi:hypothetical protein D2E97_16200 [Mycobacteroides abscessus]|uniref:hypothetical protein n=1 Tax=Mycobacteroides abscessus TaxID=36809 RepID=UPI000E69DA39|nr:hypothetical protein [Mycobacteroides abscessus]RIU09124.1 hypothetical protein D2E97_16200 [Mycobacteroides abscessus]
MSENISAASGGLQEGAELYRRLGASDIDYDESIPSQQAPAVKKMADGAELYNRMHGKAAN